LKSREQTELNPELGLFVFFFFLAYNVLLLKSDLVLWQYSAYFLAA